MRRFLSRVVAQMITATFCVASNGFWHGSLRIIGQQYLSMQLQTRFLSWWSAKMTRVTLTSYVT